MILQSHSWAYVEKILIQAYLHAHVPSSTIYNSQAMEAT